MNNTVVPFDHGYTGEIIDAVTITSNSTGLNTIKEWLVTASNNPDNLYIITYNAGGAMTVSSNEELVTDGHVKIVRGSANGNYMFRVQSNATLSIGSENMAGTIEISGGAIFKRDDSIPYVFENERKTTRNFKTDYNSDGPRVLFNDGEDYAVAHWYKVEDDSIISQKGLVWADGGTVNIYGNTRIGDVYQASCNAGECGAVNIRSNGKLNMYGGEISWNAMGIGNSGAGAAIYIGKSNASDNNTLQTSIVANIYDGLIQYNTALDSTGGGNQSYSADGGAIAIDSAVLNIRGGKITNNRSASTADMSSAANGGGVSGRNGAVINMYGGEISNNYTGAVGGGVCLWYSKFHMYGGTVTRNYARYGGGAGMSTTNVNYGSEIYLYNNATISENYAEYGGGISAGALGNRGKNAKFVMLNGNVINNTAIYEGGGICNYNYEKSSLDLRGGTISHNKAPAGAGVSIQNLGTANTSDYLLELSGGISINTNNDVLISELKKYPSTQIYQTPIWVKGRLDSTGTIALISMNDYQAYVGTDLIKFVRDTGGTLEVQTNKFSIDTNQYVLNEVYTNSTLRLEKLSGSSDVYIARNGNTIYTNLKQAVDNASNGDTIYAINNITLTETINVDKNISIVSETTKTKNDSNIIDKNLKKPDGTSVGNFTYQPVGDYTITLASNFADNNSNTSGFVIENGGRLQLGDPQYDEEDITISLGGFLAIDGNAGHEINGSLVEIQSGGELEANAGVTIGNNATASGLVGAGVNVQSGGQFTLNGASIKFNKTSTNGAAVYVAGNMTMSNGHIDENDAQNGAGIYLTNGGTVTISNGTIKDNVASNDGAGIYIATGGNVTFNNGSINDNDADNDGAGVYVGTDGTFTMKAGSINANRTVNGNGAGVYLDGDADISSGSFNGNIISSYNQAPKGRGILVNTGSELHISKDIYLDSANPIYLTSGELIYVDDTLTMSHAIPMNSEQTAAGTRIAKINTNDATRAREIETNTLYNKSIYEIENDKEIIGETAGDEYYLIYDSVKVTYNRNNAKSGDGILPTDDEQYSGGDVINIKPQISGDEVTRDGYVFIGWSSVQANPVTSAANELAIKIYYPTDLVEGVIYNHNYTIFENTTFYAVWAVDANHNTVPDYRENVLDITIAPSENGEMSSSLDQAQGGMFVLLTAAPADGYEVDTIEVKYTLNGIEGTYSLENNKVVKLDEKLFYFNMPLADATIYTTFKVQTINEVKITWNDGTEEEWGTLQSALNEIKSNTSKQGKKITLLRYVYSRIETDIPEDINIELDLNGHTLDMNYLPFVIKEGATLKISDSMTGGKISFDSSGGNVNAANNLVNNGTLNIVGGAIAMDAGSESTHNLIQNNGVLTMSAGSIKHNDENGIAIYNNGTATLTGGNINGGKYGVYQANTVANSLDISGFGPITTYGVNLDNYLSSVFVAKDTFINVSGVINNCGEDSSVSADNKIPLYLDDTIGLNEPIIKSNKVETMVKHFRMHFDLANRSNSVLAVNSSNEVVLIKKPGKLFTTASESEYQYRTEMTLNAQLYEGDNTSSSPYVGATGTVYFFLLDEEVDWHIWRPELKDLVFREGWGLDKAVGSARIDSETGLATCTISTEDLNLQTYYIFGMYYGDGTYDTYSVDGPVSSGFVGPIVTKGLPYEGLVDVIEKDISDASVTVAPIASKIYNGQDQKANVEIQVYDGEVLLVEDEDYEVQLPNSIIDAGDYTVTITGIGKYNNSRNDVTVTVKKYNGQINIDGIALKYAAGTVPNISFNGTATAEVKDTYDNVLEYGTDYDVKYYKMNTATEEYEEIASLLSTTGVYKVIATCKSSSTNYAEGLTAEAAFVISSDGAEYNAVIENNTLTYNGRERTIAELGDITVSGRASATADEETLTRDVDYSVIFGTSGVKNAGTYSVVIQGKGEYAGLVNIATDITINKKVLTKDNTTITFTDDDLEYEYNSKAIVPVIQSIEIDGVDTSGETGTSLVVGTDYITSVSGEHVKVSATDPEFLFTTLNGNYATTTLSYPFHIIPRDLTNNQNATVSIYQSGFTGEEVIPVVTVLDRVGGTSKKLTEDDFTVTYRVSDVENNTATLSNGYPINKGTYDAIITGKGNYKGQKIEMFVIGNYRGRIIATLDPNVFTYTGNESALHGSILSSLTVNRGDTISGDELVYGTDYIIGYGTPDNTVAPSEVGEYLLYIVGIGNYDEVQTTTTYQISPLTGTIHIELSEDTVVYNGKNQRPELDKEHSYMLIDGGNVYLSSLEEGRDYAVIEDENSKNVGGYILQVNGIGRYAGNYNFASYQISPRPVNDPAITIKSVASTDKEYNGQPQTLVFSPSGDAWLEYKYDEDEAPIILEENRDFNVIHSNNTNGGIAVAVIGGIGNFGGITTYTFVIESKPINSGDDVAEGFTLTGVVDREYTGSACLQEFVLTDTALNKALVEGTDYTVTYQNNFEVGTASYKIEAKGNYKGTIRGTFEITPTNISSANIVVSNDNAVYNTIPQIPKVSVSIVRNSTTIQLHEGEDYEIVLGDNEFKNVGTYNFSIRGKAGSNYTGTKEAQFTIVPYTDTLNVSLSTDIYTNGVTEETIKNNLTVTYGNDNISTDDLDITFVPATLTTGNYTVQVEAKDTLSNYYISANQKASGYALFAIEGAEEISISLTETSRVYTANTIIIPEENIIVNSGDSVAHLRGVHTDLTYMVDWNHTIKDVGTYTVTVRVLKGNNELQSATTTFEVIPKDISSGDLSVENIEDQIYTGREIRPEFAISYNEEDLNNNDYTAVYSNNKNVGQATITLVGKGNYTGTREIPFNVVSESTGDIIITLKEGNDEVTNNTYTYNDSPKTPDVLVDYVVSTGNRVELTKDTDYSVSYENNVNAGTAKAIVTLKGNYSGSAEKTFKINKFNLANAVVDVSDNAVYNGKIQRPLVEVKRGNVLLTQNEDYEVAYDGSFIDANTYSVILIRAMSGDTCNYNGEQSIDFTINKYGLNTDETLLLDFNSGSASFRAGTIDNTNTFKNELLVKDLNGNTLSNANYTVLYSSDGTTYTETLPQSIGTYTVKVTGTGINYAETYDVATRDFVIYSNTANVSDSSAVYKNAVFDISEIMNQLTITSESDPGEELPINSFNISFGSTAPKNAGTYTVIVSGKEDTPYAGILATGEFTVIPADISFTNVSDVDYVGYSVAPDMTISGVANEDLVEKKDYLITYSGDNYSSSSFTPSNVGTYQVTVEGHGNYKGTVIKTYDVNPISLSNPNVTIEVTNNELTYNTEEQLPTISVSYETDRGIIKLQSSDYEVTYSDTYIDAGNYTITVNAKENSNFTGSGNAIFTIKPYVGALNVTLSGDASYTNGVTEEEIIEDLLVKYLDETLDIDDLDVEFVPATLTTGSYSLTVKAKDTATNYYLSEDSRANGSVSFTIEEAQDIYISLVESSHVYTAGTISITYEDILVSDGVNSTKTLAELVRDNPGLVYTVTGNENIKDAGTYTINLTVTKGNNVIQSASTTYTVTKKDIDSGDVIIPSIAPVIYTGEALEPEISISYNHYILVSGDYYTVYSNNTNAGEATVTIIGRGNNFEGVVVKNFDIIEASEGTIQITLKEGNAEVDHLTYTYDGTPKTPDVIVTYYTTATNGELLVKDRDYKVTFENNIESSNSSTFAKAKVVLCGNYSGNAEKTFIINKYDLANTTIVMNNTSVYNGQKQKPQVEVKRGNVLLVENTDYTITYNGAFTNVGNYNVVIKAKDGSNYKGEITKPYTISKYGSNVGEVLLLEFANGKASFIQTITKEVFENNLVVTDYNGNVLTRDNYIVKYSTDGTNFTDTFPQGAGSYTVKVIGTGTNYAGEYDNASRDYVLYVDTIDVTDTSRTYKNAVYTIEDIIADITITYGNTELNKADFDISFGRSTPKAVGTYTVLVFGKSNTEYAGVNAAAEFDITPALITVDSIIDVDYVGKSVAPTIEISGVGDEVLVSGRDYSIVYSGDSYYSEVPPTNIGTYQAIVKGVGNYTGTVASTYRVKPITLDDSKITITVTNNNTIYNTEVQNPVISVLYETDSGIIRLTDSDYELINGSNVYKNAEDYTVEVRAKDGSNYSGSKNVTYTIKPYVGALDVTLSNTSYTNGVTKREVIDNLSIKYVNESISSDDFDITFTPDELKAGSYAIEVKATDELLNYYDSYDSRANGYVLFTINDAGNITISLTESTHVYTAHEIIITKDDVLVNNDKTVSELESANTDLDYDLEISDTIKDVGTYTITLKVSKDGNLLQQASTTYKVTQKDIADDDVVASNIPNQTYTGTALEPNFTLTYSGEELESGDYTAVYSNNTNAGVATIKAIGNGNYKGTKTITFNISAEQGELIISLYENGDVVTDTTYTYDGSAKTPEVKVEIGTKELSLGTDYTLNYGNNVNSGTARVQVVLKNNFSGDKEVEYKINKFDLANATLTLSDDKTYNGNEQKPTAALKRDNVLLVEDTDYEISYDGSFINASTYDVVITAKEDSNYKGSITEQFTISKYGTNPRETLLLEFKNGKTSYNEEVSKSEFESNLQVKDLNGNTLTSGEYVVAYSVSGDTYSSDYPLAVGSYIVKVTGTGTNYAGLNDIATREFVICVDSLDINNVAKDYKNAEYTINDIVDEITVKSNVGTELPKDQFDISFGKSTPKDVGKYTIIVSGKPESDFDGLIGTSEFTINAVNAFTVEDIADVNYTGSTSNPSIVVKGVNDEALSDGQDYTVSYTGTDVNGNAYNSTTPPTKVGEYEAIITGKRNYEGATSSKAFKVIAITSGDIDASLSQEEFVYNEANQVPVEIVKYLSTESTIMLVLGTDYDISYVDGNGDTIEKANIIEVDNYKAKISLKGNYEGKIVLDFKIVEAEITSLNISIKENSKEYNKLPQEIEIVVKDPKGNELTEGTDYKITYYKDASLTVLTDESVGATEDGKAPANSGKYYVKIEGLGDYDAVTSDATFVITKKNIDDLTISSIENQIYDGSAKEPTVTVKDGADVVSSSEYEVSYNNNTEIGEDTASITISMKDDSNYTGTKTEFFSIVVDENEETIIELKDKDGNDISEDSYTYDGVEKKPEVVVKRAGRTLEEGKDYKVSYDNNKNVGTATVKVTLKGDYSGSVSKDFTINPLDIKDATVTAKPEKSYRTGQNIRPNVEVTIGTDDGKMIKLASSDYEVIYPDSSKNVGTYTVTVKAKSNNFKGTVSGTYEIIKEKTKSRGGEVVVINKVVKEQVGSGDSKEDPVDNSLLDKVNHNSYITGYDDATFKPNKSMTRAEAVTIFARLLKEKPTISYEHTFSDVEGHWAEKDTLLMSQLGIVKGYDDGTFKPENLITRAEFATIITRFESVKELKVNASFVDVPKDHWAYDTINYARIMGWISGYEDGTFKPNNTITRAEAITIINRMLGRIGDIEKINEYRVLNKFTDIDGHWAYYGIVEATSSHEYEFDGDVEIWK